jgi:hypothetical protein
MLAFDRFQEKLNSMEIFQQKFHDFELRLSQMERTNNNNSNKRMVDPRDSLDLDLGPKVDAIDRRLVRLEQTARQQELDMSTGGRGGNVSVELAKIQV